MLPKRYICQTLQNFILNGEWDLMIMFERKANLVIITIWTKLVRFIIPTRNFKIIKLITYRIFSFINKKRNWSTSTVSKYWNFWKNTWIVFHTLNFWKRILQYFNCIWEPNLNECQLLQGIDGAWKGFRNVFITQV